MTHATWRIRLTDERSGADCRTAETNRAVADALRMEVRASVHLTLSAYLRGEDGRDPPDQGMRIDLLHGAILRHHGIHPLRLLRAGRLGLGMRLDVIHGDRWTDRTIIDDDMAPDLSGKVCITSGLRYDADRIRGPRIEWDTLAHGALPETVRGAMPGRLLADVIGHPALAGSTVRVVRIEPTGTGHMGIVVDREAGHMPPAA